VTNAVLEAIRTRRVARALTDAPIDRALVEEILKAARWAPSGGNRRLHRFVAVQDPVTLRLLRMASPGMFQRPQAVIVICIDGLRARSFGMLPTAKGLYVDVGTGPRSYCSPPTCWVSAQASSHPSAAPLWARFPIFQKA